ncbi:hypothetical protein EU92_1542 [Prochlorococcus marinus str. MIT 9107]|uniref:Uncharacterized protein n=1 Tax=Prochlorococcus marinus str. MIT 9116 TaxID=167544 RepID=A0A0A1ZVU4_PROMR|nr:hypothetical protein EU92_1542 [Prochlorococcus marinus str. MIT 9107]KGF92399.1 hypothetical protein EU93_0664 [Prochlorococcus marinus str. MIT 9116]KGF92717.1 hypothetical protein EU94_1717 [Prochlorococcus marinus str. MIT 9123]
MEVLKKTIISGNLFDFMKKRENIGLCVTKNLFQNQLFFKVVSF